MNKPRDIKIEKDEQAERAAKNLESYYSKGGDGYADAQASKPHYTDYGRRKFPINMIILLLILGIAVFQFMIHYHNGIVKMLPNQMKPSFLRAMQPFIDVSSDHNLREVAPAPQPAQGGQHEMGSGGGQVTPPNWQAHGPAAEESHDFVQIKGRYFRYNPDNLYIVDGEKIFYMDSRRKKQ